MINHSAELFCLASLLLAIAAWIALHFWDNYRAKQHKKQSDARWKKRWRQ
jgi:hypothetical protein